MERIARHVATTVLPSGLLMARTDGRTNERPNQLPETSSVLERTGEIEKWIIRQKRFPWTGELAWRVSHSSLPQGRPLFGSVHLDTWQDALDYALAKAEVAS